MNTAKRFWKHAVAVPFEGGFGIELDGRAVRTPAKAALVLPTLALAQHVAAEWAAQGDRIDPATMPATRMANAAIDKVMSQFDAVATQISAYGDSDLLCYRATAPVELVARQAENWDPMLAWAATDMGVRLNTISGVMHVAQDAGALADLARAVSANTPYELAAFHDLVSISGSLILGFATIQNVLETEEIWALACLDELWQEEKWGHDDEATAHRARKRQDFFDAARFFALCKLNT